MMTAKENFLELLKPDGQPERQLRQYEALHMCLNDPANTYLRGNRKRGTVSVDRWGTTISFPADAPGPMPLTGDGLAVCPDVTRWRETVHAPDLAANCTQGWEEARAAAREKRRQRDEAAKAAAKEKRQVQQEQQVQAAQVLEQAQPAAKKRRRRGRCKAQSEFAETVQVMEPQSESLSARDKRPRRGVRSGTLMDTGDAMPRTEFHRPNPLDSDVIMDATARLLAPRKPLYGSSPVRDSRSPRKEGSRRKAAPQPRQEEQSPAPEQKPPKKRRSRKKSAAQPAGQQAAAPQKGAAHQEQARKERSGRGKKHSHDRGGRGPMEPHKSGQTKDSTEQASLIKPFYINVGR